MINYRVKPQGQARGKIRVPGDKSISHRSIMFGAIAEGVTEVSGFLEGADALCTLEAFRALGVEIIGPDDGKVTIHGVGMHGLKAPKQALDMGNSGTSMRLLAGLLAGQGFAVEMVGDASLSKRPMRRVTDPLALMGADAKGQEDGTPPIQIHPVAQLQAIDYAMPMASAQVKSCVLLAGLYAQGQTIVHEPAPTRDHTERMLRGFSYPVETQGSTIKLNGGGKLIATKIDVPSDISSATFFMVAAAICPDSDITIEHVGMNPTRIGVINILRAMGADLSLSNESEVGGEPVADVRVRYAPLQGIEIPEDQVPLAIDEFPALFIAAACASGTTVLRGAEELRVKESDRIQVMVDGLVDLGIKAEPTEDGVIIEGGVIGGDNRVADTVEIITHHDHRIAMSFAMASLRSECDILIKDCGNVATSFPNFVELAQEIGVRLTVEQA